MYYAKGKKKMNKKQKNNKADDDPAFTVLQWTNLS